MAFLVEPGLASEVLKASDGGSAADRRKPARVVTEEASGRILAAQGSARFHLFDTAFPEYLHESFMAFACELPTRLRPDPYDPSGLRYRRYVSLIYVPDSGGLTPMGRSHDDEKGPKARYFQPAAYQPEEGDHVRTLDSLTEQQIASPVLSGVVATDFRIARNSGLLPVCPAYIVGVHFICLRPLGRKLAAVTPNTIHRDGELLTFAHLIGKWNVRGGWNAITRKDNVDRHPSELPDDEILTRFTLEEPGESYVVDDRKVAHFVEGVGLEDVDQSGHRTVALIDFSPLRRVRSNDLDTMSRAELLDLGQ